MFSLLLVLVVKLPLCRGVEDISVIPLDQPRNTPAYDAEPKRLIHYAAMAYCSDKSIMQKSCGPCRKIDQTVRFKGIYEFYLNGHALMLVDHQKREVIVAFRGLTSMVNLKKSLDMKRYNLKAYIFDNSTRIEEARDVRVHRGFKETADSLRDYILPELKDLFQEHKDYRLQLVGHSLGGAIATLMTIIIHQEMKFLLSRISLTTYGQPRVGNYVFAKWFNSLPVTAIRVVNEDDSVPHLPGKWNRFVHIKSELYITNGVFIPCPPFGKFLEDPQCSSSRSRSFGYSSHLEAWGIPLTTEAC
ncbi:hypothetical protein DSO57_1016056 [Entomophthora muscae]|uniref:Uncharacterized protein n=1 Tax=Entomophthora muscae TaxID=34485 RepID=A0ACC2UQX3_9FUNG|nr:hypothetical protein DSO57_1016056 [Entomophthora muscae]